MNDDAFRDALGRALRRLEASDRYESEVRAALSKDDPEVVERVLDYLRTHRFLNDARTTANAVERNTGRRALGDARMVERLVARGADEAEVAAALAEAEDESVRIDTILTTKYKPTDDPAKAGRFLFGRGFSEEAIDSALERYFVREETP
ncbi:MAG: hypothetical protein ACO1SV_14805 [Fimbriimonas sp.]